MPVFSETAIQISGTRTPSRSKVTIDCFTGDEFNVQRSNCNVWRCNQHEKRPENDIRPSAQVWVNVSGVRDVLRDRDDRHNRRAWADGLRAGARYSL